MHPNSMRLMKYFRDEYIRNNHFSVLDIGSREIGKNSETYRSIFSPPQKYIGMDIEPGKGVDIVGYENIVSKYDVLISGQVMEHVCRPWEWLSNLAQYFTEYICIIAPNTHDEHKYPLDTYRYFPDGMRDLFEYAKIKEVEIFRDNGDTIGIGRK